jgi:hypothetical protein
LHAGDDPRRARAAVEKHAPTREEIVDAISGNICRCTGYAQIVEAIALAAERMRGQNQAGAAMSAPANSASSRPTAACARTAAFVVGKGNFAADIVPQGVKHVALVTCPHPAARSFRSTSRRRWRCPACTTCWRGWNLPAPPMCWRPASIRRMCRAIRWR